MEAKWMLVAMVCFLPQLLLGNEWTPGDRACTCLYKATCSYLTASQNLHGGDMIRDMMPGCTILECRNQNSATSHQCAACKSLPSSVQGWSARLWGIGLWHLCVETPRLKSSGPSNWCFITKNPWSPAQNSTKVLQLRHELRVGFPYLAHLGI